MARSRSTMLVAIGAAVFVAGSALAFIAVRGGDDPEVTADAGDRPAAQPSPGAVTAPGAGAAAPVSFTIPEGMQAVAVQVPFVQGVAGFAKAGDRVNVYGVFKNKPANDRLEHPAAKLALPNVEVLTVSSPAPGTGTGNATYLLALSGADAEQVIYLQSHEGIYLTLAREDQGPLSTSGRSPANAA